MQRQDNPQIEPVQSSLIHLDAAAIERMVAKRREGGFSRTLHDVAVVAWRNILIDIRNPASLLVAALFSTSLLFVFTASFARVVDPEGGFSGYAQFLLPFIVAQGLLFNTVDISIFFYNDLEKGMDQRLRAMPIARMSALAGRLVSSGARLLFLVVSMVLAGYVIGFRLNGNVIESALFFALPVVFTLSVALVGFYIAVGAKSTDAISAVINPLILPLTFLSVGYVPASGFPDWAVPIVLVNPVSHISLAMRSLAAGTPAYGSIAWVLAWTALLMFSFGTLTIRAYKKKT